MRNASGPREAADDAVIRARDEENLRKAAAGVLLEATQLQAWRALSNAPMAIRASG